MTAGFALAPPVEPLEVRRPEDRIACLPYRATILARACVAKRRHATAAPGKKRPGEAFTHGPRGEHAKCLDCPIGPIIEEMIGPAVDAAAPAAIGTLPPDKASKPRRRLQVAGRPRPGSVPEEERDEPEEGGVEYQDDDAEAAPEEDPGTTTRRTFPGRDGDGSDGRSPIRKSRGVTTSGAASASSKSRQKPRNAPQPERDEEIRAALRSGAAVKDLAARHGLSKWRIYRIVRGEPRPGPEGRQADVHRDVKPENLSLDAEIARWREQGALLRARVTERLAAVEEEAAELRAAAASLDGERSLVAAPARSVPPPVANGRKQVRKPHRKGTGERDLRARQTESTVQGYLGEHGAQPVRAMLAGLKLDEVSVRNALWRMKRRGEVFLAGARGYAYWATSKKAAEAASRAASKG